MPTSKTKQREFDRRRFIASVAASLLGVRAATGCAESRQPNPADPRAKRVIYLYMDGGMSQLDTFDPKPGTEVQGSTKSIATNVAGLRVAHHFEQTARFMDKLTVIRSMNTTQGAHRQARYFLRTSHRLDASMRHPALGSWIARGSRSPDLPLPGNVVINPNSDYPYNGFLNVEFAAMAISKPSDGLRNIKPAEGVSRRSFDEQLEFTRALNRDFQARFSAKTVTSREKLYEQAVRLMRCKETEAFDIAREPESIRERYGDTPFGQGCLLARRLAEQDVKFVEVVKSGWDTHHYNFVQLDELAADLDRALSALLADLTDRGLLDSTLVVLATEFGRTPEISQPTNGRGHHVKAFSCLLAGGGVPARRAFGKTDANGDEVVDGGVTIPDLNATIAKLMGVSSDEKYEFDDRRRAIRMADDGALIKKLL
jgi:hypothetical protein